MRSHRRAAFVFSAGISLLFLAGLMFSTLGNLPDALSSLCVALTNMLPIVGMLMILFAAAVYAIGQIMGAETRARANVWATAAIGGALMAFLIVAVAPPIMQAMFGGGFNCYGGAPGGGTMCGPIPYDPTVSACCMGGSPGMEHTCPIGQCCSAGCAVWTSSSGWFC